MRIFALARVVGANSLSANVRGNCSRSVTIRLRRAAAAWITHVHSRVPFLAFINFNRGRFSVQKNNLSSNVSTCKTAVPTAADLPQKKKRERNKKKKKKKNTVTCNKILKLEYVPIIIFRFVRQRFARHY